MVFVRLAGISLGLGLGLWAAGAGASPPSQVVLDWNAVMMAAIRLDNTGPTLSTRNLAILHLAIYEAVNSIYRTHQPYRFSLDAPPGTSAEAAAAGAGYEILKALYPGIRARADDTFAEWRRGVPNDVATTGGLELGRTAAQLTLAERANDGSATEVPYIPSAAPGQWRRTPPFYRPPLTPHWRYVDLFALPELEPFVPGPPPALDSPEYAADLNEVKAIGGKNSAVRTAYQGETAVFWSDFSYTAMPPGHWHEIAADIVRTRGLNLPDTARLMALLSLAQADSAIVCWEAKYRYNLWRPVTAIQRADEDNNPVTEGNPTWDHLLAAPPFPAYTSGHSTFSKASAVILARFFGTDAITFTAASDSLPGVRRTYGSLAACADEVGMSRIYGGIHFAFDNREGKASGQRVAEYVFANYLLPNQRLPLVQLAAISVNEAQVRVLGHVGATCVLEASTDFREWWPVATGVAIAGGSVIRHPVEGASHLFYRVREP